MEPRASFLSNTKGIHVGAVCAIKKLLLATSFNDSSILQRNKKRSKPSARFTIQANLIDCVSHMFFKSDKQFVLRWTQFGDKTHIFILLESILEFTIIMAATALKV